jgi:hypothetical protein
LVSAFCKEISGEYGRRLARIRDLRINIMNQNIELMPDRSVFEALFKISKNITQTVAHHRYANNEICNKYGIPLSLIPAYLDLSRYYDDGKLMKKERIISYSNDDNPNKNIILNEIKTRLPSYKLIEINKMTFSEYVHTVSKSKYVISFGEGFDYYLLQSFQVGSVGFAVYNDVFFPDKKILEFKNIFPSYKDMLENFVSEVKMYDANDFYYKKTVSEFYDYLKNFYNEADYKKRIRNFYERKYDFS